MVRRVVVGLALGAAVVMPAVGAPARDGGVVCDSAVEASGRCDARRPAPSIRMLPAAPRAGTTVVLVAGSPGRGVAYAWDLDGDGAFDDAAGARATAVFAAGERVVGVRATDEDGRVGSEVRTFAVHGANASPSGRLRVLTPSPGAATVTEVAVDGVDPDGHVAKVEFDIHGDGEYEVAETFGPGETAHAEHSYPDPVVGSHTTAARITDDAGASSELITSLDVHLANVPPVVSIDVSPATPRPGEAVTVSAVATDLDGPRPSLTFDLDGDGTYETDAGAASSVPATAGAAGVREFGVQAHDVDGATGFARRSVEIASSPRAPLEIGLPAGPVRPGTDVTFTANAAVAWDTDDDGAFDDEPTRAFAAAGAYPVRARAADGRVAMRTLAVIEDRGLPPAVTALELPAAIQAGRPAVFSVAAVDPDGGPVAYSFDLDGDGAFDDRPEPVAGGYRWTFPAGPVTVAVRATDPSGNTATRTAQLRPSGVNLPPDAALEAGPLVAGEPTALHATGADPEGGDVTFAVEDTVTPSTTGPYTLHLRATDDAGGAVEIERTAGAGTRAPIASFTAPPARVGEALTLTSTATDPDGSPLTGLAWDLDDDGAFDDASGSTARVTPASAGEFTVGLKARDASGDAGIRYERVTVAPADPTPTATASPTATPTASPSASPTAGPSASPSASPTASPSASPSASPTVSPTASPTASPSASPAASPTAFASASPSASPKAGATASPSASPAASPVATVGPSPRRLEVRVTARVAKRAEVVGRGLRVPTRCSDACVVTVVASVDARTARQLGVRTVARLQRRLGAGVTTALVVRPGTRARRAWPRERTVRLRLQLTAVAADGRRAHTTKTVSVRVR